MWEGNIEASPETTDSQHTKSKTRIHSEEKSNVDSFGVLVSAFATHYSVAIRNVVNMSMKIVWCMNSVHRRSVEHGSRST